MVKDCPFQVLGLKNKAGIAAKYMSGLYIIDVQYDSKGNFLYTTEIGLRAVGQVIN